MEELGMEVRRGRVAPYVVLAVITLVTFWPCVGNGFLTWDDPDTIWRNEDLSPAVTWESFRHFWTREQGDLYVPVTYSVWGVLAMIGRKGAGVSPGVFHGFNVLVHLGSVGLAYWLLLRLTRKTWAALVGAAVFAVHPVQVEAVAWASGTKDLLAGFFGLGAVCLYVLGVEEAGQGARGKGQGWGQSWAYWGALGCFALALLSKPSAVGMVGVAFVIGWWVRGMPWRGAIKSVVPWLAVAVPVVVVGKMAQPAQGLPYVAPVYLRPVVVMDAIGFYLRHLVWPAGLGVDYGRSPEWVLKMGVGTWVDLGLAVLAVGAMVMWRRMGCVGVGAVMFVCAVGPMLGLVSFDFQQYSTVSDHYLYLGMVGVGLVVAGWLPGVEKAGVFFRKPVVVGVVIVVALGMGRSFTQGRYWVDSETLFARTLEVNPRSPAARVNLAIALADKNRLPEAAAEYEALLAANSKDAKGHLGLGQVLARMGRHEEGMGHLRRAVELQPGNPMNHYNLGLLLATMGKGEEAEGEYRRAIEIEPGFAEARTNLGTLLLMRGDLDGAEGEYRKALAVRGNLTVPKRGLEEIERVRRGR